MCIRDRTETTLTIANLTGNSYKLGSMGKPTPAYDIALVDPDGNPVPLGETGEVVVRTDRNIPCGLFSGYYKDEEKTREVWHDGMYHTGDLAWMDEDGFFWYVGRADDVIKSSGYRIGPFEIESVIMELPYVLECGVSAAPDEVRGQVVKASIVLTKGTEGTEELKKEIQEYVKTNTAPYKYPRIVEFRTELPKTCLLYTSGVISLTDGAGHDHSISFKSGCIRRDDIEEKIVLKNPAAPDDSETLNVTYDKSLEGGDGYSDVYTDGDGNEYVFKDGKLSGYHSSDMRGASDLADCAGISAEEACNIAVKAFESFGIDMSDLKLKKVQDLSLIHICSS